jgi:mono/diheme cytochrome c family protein
MNSLATVAVLGALVGAFALSVHAEEPSASDGISAGRALSLKVCAACHVVSSDQEMAPFLRPPAPTFRSIANRPGMTTESVRHSLTEAHRGPGEPGRMPNLSLTEDQARQVAAFLMSLRDRH